MSDFSEAEYLLLSGSDWDLTKGEHALVVRDPFADLNHVVGTLHRQCNQIPDTAKM